VPRSRSLSVARPAFALLLASTSPAAAQTAPGVDGVEGDLHRLTAPIRFDGRVDDDEWEAVPVLPLIQFWPTWGDPVVHRTEIRLAYDDEYLYLAARCADTRPPTMTTYRRDAWDDRDDQVAIGIDSFNDYENQLVFATYATGARIDSQFSDDAREGFDPNTDWNTYWDAETTVHETGWDLEVRIPFSSLRFETSTDGPVTMGINVFRYRPQEGYLYHYPGSPNDWGYWSFLKPSKGARRTLHGIESSKPLYVSPYVTSGLGQNWALDDAGTAYRRSDEADFDAGLDLKYSLTSNLTLDLTANTDFAQVEADDQQVNLTRFSLFFPEKRQFFLERTSTFDFSFGGSDRLFYSRRIGVAEGQEVTLLGGGRVVGRVGDWDVGLLNLQTGRTTVDTDDGPLRLGTENFGVVRLKRRVLNENSWLGGIGTSRIGEGGDRNVSYGLDGVVNVTGDEYLRFAWAQTFDDGRQDALAALDNSRFRLGWERSRSIGFIYGTSVSRSGYGYRPGIGFQRREDYTQLEAEVGYGRLSSSASTIRGWSVEAEVESWYENRREAFGTLTTGAGGEITFRSGASLRGHLNLEWEDLAEGFSLSDDAEVPSGEYTFVAGEVGGESPAGNPLYLSGELRFGGFFDGRQFVAILSPKWSATERISVTGTYQYSRITLPERDQVFEAHLVRGRVEWTLNTRITLSTLVQYSGAADAAILNFRFRYNPRDGNDLYLVYNEGFNTDRHAGDPMLPFTSGRTVIAKYVHTFRW
jgi:hypothetical protein